jgi:hypothetical protein
MAGGAVEPSLVPPVDPFGCSQLDLLHGAPRPSPANQLRLVKAVGLGEGVVVGVAFGANRGHRALLGKPLGVANRQVLDAAVGVMHQAGVAADVARAGG